MSRQQKFFRTIVDKVEPATKAAKLREVMPEIERKIAAGAHIADIVDALNSNGFDITLATLKSYLYRFRKAARQSAPHDRAGVPVARLAAHADTAAPDPHRDSAATTTGLLRHINTARCMRMLRRGTPLTRADLARELNLTRATIGRAIGELLEAGLVTETAERAEEARLGRPGTTIRLNPDGAYSIGIDISSTSACCAASRCRSDPIRATCRPSSRGSPAFLPSFFPPASRRSAFRACAFRCRGSWTIAGASSLRPFSAGMTCRCAIC
jgi:DNA-binding transcriptional ArsR family regulator